MKKLNVKGFTLIELLAVITIMGILMLVAIPTVSRTIENSRKDTFLDTVKQYTNSVKTMWAADNLTCTVDGTPFVSSAVPTGLYRVNIDTSNPTAHPVLLEQGGKSPWGSRDMKGFILVFVQDKNGTRKITNYPVLVDGVHGINVNNKGTVATLFIQEGADDISSLFQSEKSLSRADIRMSGAAYGDSSVDYSVAQILDDGKLNNGNDYKITYAAPGSYVDYTPIVCVES